MSTEIICAIIGGCAVITAAIIAAVSAKRKKEKSKTKTVSPISVHEISGSNVVVGNENDVNYFLPPKDDSSVEIVDTLFDVDDDGFFIDIKLRNKGDRVAFIKRITFMMYDIYSLKNPQITRYSLIPSTATYDVILDGTTEQSFPLSQSVNANDVDRFRIKVASSIAETRMVTVYHFSYIIHYDNNKQTENSPGFISVFPSDSAWGGCYVSHTSMEIAEKNYLELSRISKIDCIKSDIFLSLLKSYEDVKTDLL